MTIPAPDTDDVRLIWGEEDITGIQLQCVERLGDTLPELSELHTALHAYMVEYLPHRLGRRTTLAALGIDVAHQGPAFVARYNRTHSKIGSSCLAQT